MSRLLLCPTLLALAAAPAWAQPAGADAKQPPDAPAPAPPPEPPRDVDDAAEDPTRPAGEDPVTDAAATDELGGNRVALNAYPREEVQRPLTLPELMTEVTLTTGATLSPFVNSNVLHARFGVVEQLELGLTYNIGGLHDDDEDGPKSMTFNPGKAIGVDVTYRLIDQVAVQLGVPFYVDPLAVGLRLAAPVRVRVGERLYLQTGHDLLDIKLKGFVPQLDREKVNEGYAALVDSNSVTSNGTLRFLGRAAYQSSPKLALIGDFGWRLDDFSSKDSNYPLWLTAQFSPRHNLDVAGTAGFETLDRADRTFGLFGTVRLRL